jgi:hypothetical protein
MTGLPPGDSRILVPGAIIAEKPVDSGNLPLKASEMNSLG